jgi:hypothetical protein
MDRLPGLLERKKIGGKDLPTEVFIRHKRKSRLLPVQIHAMFTARQLHSTERSRRCEEAAQMLIWMESSFPRYVTVRDFTTFLV